MSRQSPISRFHNKFPHHKRPEQMMLNDNVQMFDQMNSTQSSNKFRAMGFQQNNILDAKIGNEDIHPIRKMQ